MKKLLICTHLRNNPNQPSCAARGSKTLAYDLTQIIKNKGLEINVEQASCLGFCEIGINLRLSPNGNFIHHANNNQQSKTDILSTVMKFILQD